nr:uncharacterized protein LOC113709706 [Coffea arabica]
MDDKACSTSILSNMLSTAEKRYCQCGGSGTICSLPMGNEHHMIEPTSKSLGSIVVPRLVSRIDAAAAASRGLRCYHVAEPFDQSAKRNLMRGTFQFENEHPCSFHTAYLMIYMIKQCQEEMLRK